MLTIVRTHSGARYHIDASAATIVRHWAGGARDTFQNVTLRRPVEVGECVEFTYRNRGECLRNGRPPVILSSFVTSVVVVP